MAVTEAATQPAPARSRRWWLLAIRVTVSIALLAVLVSRLNIDSVLPRQRHLSTLGWLAAAIATALIGIALSAWRWQRVLAVFDVPVRLRILLSHYLAGQFVGNVLPSTIGGDVLRVTRGTRTTGSSSTAFASVALERLTGFVALPLLCVIGFALQPSLLGEDHAWIALAISGGTVFALTVILVLAGSPRIAGRFREHENRMRFIGAVHIGVDRMRARPRLVSAVLGTAIIYQASTVLTVWFAARTLGVDVPTAAIIAFVPAVAMAQVVPVSVGGFGVREGMLALFLTPLGVSTGRAVGIGLLWYFIMLVVSLAGAPAFAVGHRHPGPDPTSDRVVDVSDADS
ncbi:MAG TPA: lysylphosphatidylglycerol synthase transmembrane domain-containing protein [Acidimicrobiia bacterium]|nr:lysylphosphatidylglycerol synthase transmembrane domain-containing protein [Acidimicrobiia bacterium]